MFNYRFLYFTTAMVFAGILSTLSFAQGQGATLQGQIVDQQGAIIIGATVEAIDAGGQAKTVITNEQGEFVFKNIVPGKYMVRAIREGFAVYENAELEVGSNAKESLKITLEVAVSETVVDVATEAPVNTEPDKNVGGFTLKDGDLDPLPDDPDELLAALQALAGPAAGPNGGDLFIDGVSGAGMPPKSSIREIRINSNPFSAEYDRVGFGRIEILTKPGTNSFHGQSFFNFNDESMNARNPFASGRAPYQLRQFGGNFSGAFSAKGSFFIDFERRSIDDLAVVNASILDSDLNIVPFSQSIQSPLTRTSFNPRVDYQINDTNYLTARLGFNKTTDENNGVGGFSLASRSYNTSSSEKSFQLTETSVLSKSIISETRFQFVARKSENLDSNSTSPTIQVLDAFTSGGSSVGNSSSETNRWELANSFSWTLGKHSFKAGARFRGISIDDISTNNFAGTYTFTSLGQYRNVLLGVEGAAPAQFTITAGNPEARISQLDFSPFIQDDWRILPNLTINLGLRYEAQTNVTNNINFAPRIGFAWSPDYANGRNGKTVIRGGFGIFFDRIGESLSLRADRYNGENLQSFIVTDQTLLGLYPNVPSIDTLLGFSTALNTYKLADNIRSPYNMQTNIGVERQLPFNLSLAVNYSNTRGYNQLRSRNINAPVGYIFGDPTSGIRPFGNVGNIYQYESTGKLAQNQLTFNVRSNFSRKYSLFAMYMLGNAKGDTDGAGSFPSNSYDLNGDYGRSSLDIRQRLVLGGMVQMPLGLRLNPFVIVSSGRPFNITRGLDLNGDSIFTERPTYSQLNARCNALGLTDSFCDISGISDVNAVISRNYGTGPSFTTVNLRLTKSFGFGGEATGGGNNNGGGRGGMMGGGNPTSKKYNLMFSLTAQNLLNTVNAGSPVGNLSSTLFGRSNSIGGGFGFGPGGMSSSSAAFNRKIEAQIRFSF